MLKVGICVPSGGYNPSEFTLSLAALVACMAVPRVIIGAESSMIQVNRDKAVRQARGAGCSHVLFLDDDMVMPPDAGNRLLAHDRDIVGCLYARRVPPHHSAVGRLLPGQSGALQKAATLGLGCALIRTTVFDRMRAPYFRQVAIESTDSPPADLTGFDLDGIKAPDTLSEDYYFCGVARREGFDVWADVALSAELGHVGKAVYRLEGDHGRV